MCATDADSLMSASCPYKLLVDAGTLRPYGCHRDVPVALGLHAIADERPSGLVGLAVVAHAALLEGGCDLVVVVFDDHFRQRAAKVPQKPIARPSALDDPTCEGGQPDAKVVATASGELRRQLLRPVLRPCLPAVADQEPEPTAPHERASRARVLVEVLGHIAADVLGIQLVHFKTGGFRGGGMVRHAEQRVAEPEDDPLAGRRRPVQRTVRPHPRGQIDDVRLADRVGRRDVGRRKVVQTVQRSKGGFLLEPVYACARVKY